MVTAPAPSFRTLDRLSLVDLVDPTELGLPLFHATRVALAPRQRSLELSSYLVGMGLTGLADRTQCVDFMK